MPWVFSEPEHCGAGPTCGARLSPAMAGLILLLAAPPAQASSWLQGVFPVPSFAGFTSGYGMRLHPLAGVLRSHDGIDIAAPLGSPVRSWWSGRIVEVISDGGCGNGLVIRSGDYEHIYCHLAGSTAGGIYRSGPVQLAAGRIVGRGELIGHVGLSGTTTGPHLHWGIRHRGRWLDPARILRAMAASRRRILSRGAAPNVGQMR